MVHVMCCQEMRRFFNVERAAHTGGKKIRRLVSGLQSSHCRGNRALDYTLVLSLTPPPARAPHSCFLGGSLVDEAITKCMQCETMRGQDA